MRFGRLGELLNQEQTVGGLGILDYVPNEERHYLRFIYYLITKQFSYLKPTYATLWASLSKMRYHIINNNIQYLAIPRIACNLDKLDWFIVKHMINFLFRNVSIKIVICLVQSSPSAPPTQKRDNICKITYVNYPLVHMEYGSILLYFINECGGIICDTMYNLDKKFHFINDFYGQVKNRVVGNVIKYLDNVNHFLLLGCVVKKNMYDKCDFVNFENCLRKINEEYVFYNYYYVGIELVDTNKVYNEKVVSLMRNVLMNVEIYVCKK